LYIENFDTMKSVIVKGCLSNWRGDWHRVVL